MTQIDLLTFAMRGTPPADGADWFRIVNAKTKSEATKVYIYDEIGYWGTSAKDFAALLNEIDSDQIELHLNSPGGSVFDGLAIYASLKNHKATVTAIVDGLAASAASFILQAADTRMSTRNAQVMIHDATAYAGGNAEQMRKAADLLDRVSDNIADIYAVRSGQGTITSWRDIMRAGDEWYSGNEALDAGLVDEVVDNPEEDEDEPEEASNKWSASEVEAFLKTPPEKLAAGGKHVTITNRVEEAQMTGEDPNKKQSTPPPAAQPPAAASAPAAPAVQAQVPDALRNFVKAEGDTQVFDFEALANHVSGLETFRTEAIESARKEFVAKLVKENKILANDENLTATEAFALSLSSEQFAAWKATMEAAPASKLFETHGTAAGDESAPQNDSAKSEIEARISTLREIVQSHRDSGLSEEQIEAKDSFKELAKLEAQLAGN